MAPQIPRKAVKLPTKTKAELEAVKEDFESIKRAIGVMEELGVDVTEIKEKMDWAAKVRETLLKEFG